ncbi:LysM domain-containing protein [Alkalibacterium subtropicum]|uniref:LysM domain-containing protein n=1 Tax=Alkalibacterium subtropicum TaxID=753702 RepID=A0A1I1EVD9_9LACT|nr:N-acetylmuramoyl-L-alanine amidase [Alkalibacterium subtropicum]SFB91074.1 LysM domain-containing protein [Alkalibacterium subtropicum]
MSKVHGLFLDVPKFVDYRAKVVRHAWKKFPVLDMEGKTEIAIHHSLTRQGLSGSNAWGYSKYHVDTHNWPGIGYSYVIEPDGTIKFCNPINWRTYHVGNSNNFSIGIVLTGDFRYEEPTEEQKESLRLLVARLKKEYPQINRVRSHDEYPDYYWKSCCEFDYQKVLAEKPKVPVKEELGSTYKVQEGDTFWSIAKGRDFNVIDLEHANPKVDARTLQIGQMINIPGKEEERATEEEKKSPAYHGNSIQKYLESIGEDGSFAARKRRAEELGIKGYKGTAAQNLQLLGIIRDGNKPPQNVAKIAVDGSWGQATTKRLQQVLGTPVTGLIGGQSRHAVTNNIPSVRFGTGGSAVIREMQRRLKVTVDGSFGPGTLRALQRRMGTPVTGAISRTNSSVVKEMQRRLNENRF